MKNFSEWTKSILYIILVLMLAVLDIAGIKMINAHMTAAETSNEMSDIISSEVLMEDTTEDTTVETAVESFHWQLNDISQVAEKKHAYLTFDDGPSPNTDKILDVLAEKGVKATFFVVGKTGEKAEERYRRIVEEGHSLGIHSYSHDYSEIYTSLENYKADVLKLKDYLYEVTGEDVWLYRFPGGSSNRVSEVPIQECISFLEEEGLSYFDWNCSSEDAVEVNAPCSTLNSNVLKDALRFKSAVILMHDLYECNNTVDSLEALIDRLLEEGYEIDAITRETTPVQHVKSDKDRDKN